MVVNLANPRFVVLGGGHGLSVLLKGLKRFTEDITAVVSVADDGGGSGRLRREMGILPPGDIRNCLVALANTEPSMELLLQYRYGEGVLKGQNFGNLLIAALYEIYGDFEEALWQLSNVLRITGKVLPVTVDDVRLVGYFSNGESIMGESNIPKYARENHVEIVKIALQEEDVHANEDCLEAIEEAQVIVLGPGSLYTSIIPNLIVPGVAEAIQQSSAKLVYIANVTTQFGETHNMNVLDHIEALERHGLSGRIDEVIVNTTPSKISRDDGENVQLLMSEDEEDQIREKGISIEKGDFIYDEGDQVTHDGLTVSQKLFALSDEWLKREL